MIHIFDTDIAEKYGINSAIILQNVCFWIKQNKANNINFYDGRYWTYNSRRAYAELFPYMSERQIETAFKKLIDDGILITGNYNKVAYDRTLWYALSKKGECISHFDGMDSPKMLNGLPQNVEPIPDINSVKKPTIKHKYGEYNNVLLSDEDVEKLKSEYPTDYLERIERLSEYIESKGAKYKNHLATIRSWARKDKTQPTKPTTKKSDYNEFMDGLKEFYESEE